VIFTGHPDMRRLLTDYGFGGASAAQDSAHALRRGALQTIRRSGCSTNRPSQSDSLKFDFSRRGKGADYPLPGDEKATDRPAANGRSSTPQLHHQFGPQPPAAHGVLRLVLELDGEVVARSIRISACFIAAPKADRAQDLLAGDTYSTGSIVAPMKSGHAFLSGGGKAAWALRAGAAAN